MTLVQVLVGRDAGAVRDIRAAEACAMVADGRAVWPEGSPYYVPPVSDEPRVTQQVASRVDRGMPSGRQRRNR